jgi:glycerol-3-phosphate O-acyltransferase
VYLSFGEPISLNEVLGDRKQRFVEAGGVPEIEDEKRRFVQKLGFRLLREVNECSVAGATSISAAVLLAAPHGGTAVSRLCRAGERAREARPVRRCRADGVPEAQHRRFPREPRIPREQRLDRHDAARAAKRYSSYARTKRLALDFYKNNLIHAFLIPSLTAYGINVGKRGYELVEEVWSWLDLFRYGIRPSATRGARAPRQALSATTRRKSAR